MFFVYLLKSLKDRNHYVGQTDDINRRVDEHNSGKVTSTKYRRPLVLVGYKMFNTRSESRWFEYQVKHHGDRKKKFIKEVENMNVDSTDRRASGQ